MQRLFILVVLLTPIAAQARPADGPVCGGSIAAAPARTRELFAQARASVEGEPFYAYLRQHAGAPLSCSGSQTDGGYAIEYLFPDESLLSADAGGGETGRTLLTHGLSETDAMRLLHDMAGASSDIDWTDPVTTSAEAEGNPLLMNGWQETAYSADTECRSRAGIVHHRQDVVGLTYKVAC